MTYRELLGTLLFLLIVFMIFAQRIDASDTTVTERVRSFFCGVGEVCWIVFGTILLVPLVCLVWMGFLLHQLWHWFWFGERSTHKASETPWMSP